MFPGGKANFLSKKIGCSVNRGHETAAVIDEFDESDDDVLLLFFLYLLTCSACWLSCRCFSFALVPYLLGRVCAFELYQF